MEMKMDIYTKFNRKDIEDRQIDTFIGLSKGLIADGKINQKEAEFLQTWLIQNSRSSENPIIHNLLEKIGGMLEDNFLDEDEAAELLSILRKVSGEESVVGELARTTSLPVCDPAPKVQFDGKVFLFTGTCVYGTRKDCQSAIESLGASFSKSVTKSVDYLVLGTYVTDSWKHETFGRKIEKAMEYRDAGVPISIITEEHWLDSSGLNN
jgi:NAD-dependent DNA ligase